MDCTDIVRQYLVAHGLDGLCNSDGECGCLTDDLAPCGAIGGGCKPAYRHDCDCGDAACGFHMLPYAADMHH